MKDFAVYTVLRLALFVACYATIVAVYLLLTDASAIPRFWPLLAAVVASSLLSYPLLRVPREKFARRIDERAQRAAERFEEARAKEDED